MECHSSRGMDSIQSVTINLRGWITNRSCEKTTSKMLYGSVSTLSNISIFLVDVTNCATRLRVNVKDEKLVQSDSYFKSIGTHGLKATKTNIQVIVGLKVPSVREDFEALL